MERNKVCRCVMSVHVMYAEVGLFVSVVVNATIAATYGGVGGSLMTCCLVALLVVLRRTERVHSAADGVLQGPP